MTTGIIEGKDGWLFLRDGTNRTMDKLSGRLLLPEAEMTGWAMELERRKQHSFKYGYKYRYIIVPEKQCVYQEYLPPEIKISGIRPATQLLAAFPDVVAYLLPYLHPESGKELYYKTDTHWNPLGAAIALNGYLPPITGQAVDYSIGTTTIPGDLGKRYSPPRQSHSSIVKIKGTCQKIYDNMIPNSGRIIITDSGNQNLPVGLVFGDSMFTNIISFLSQYFSHMYYFHASVFDYHIIESIKPDVVLNENIERFIGPVGKYSFNDIFTNKLMQINFADRDQLSRFLKLPEIDLGLDLDLMKAYVDSARFLETSADFDTNRIRYINDNNLIRTLPQKERPAMGYGWPGNERTRFSGWGAAYIHDSETPPLGFAITLNNLEENDSFTIRTYEVNRNSQFYNTNELLLAYSRDFQLNSLYIYDDRQEVLFPLHDLRLERGKCYLFTVEGAGFLGCASSLADLHPENYLFRGYFKFKNDTVYRSITGSQSIAWRFIFPSERLNNHVCNFDFSEMDV